MVAKDSQRNGKLEYLPLKKGKQFTEEHKQNLSESHLGQTAPNKKLTLEQAREMRLLYNNKKFTQKELGIKYGLSQPTINDIVRHLTYKEV